MAKGAGGAYQVLKSKKGTNAKRHRKGSELIRIRTSKAIVSILCMAQYTLVNLFYCLNDEKNKKIYSHE